MSEENTKRLVGNVTVGPEDYLLFIIIYNVQGQNLSLLFVPIMLHKLLGDDTRDIEYNFQIFTNIH